MRTLPCRDCGLLYTDNISDKVNLDKGGYIVCNRCSNMLPNMQPHIKSKPPVKWKKKLLTEYAEEAT